MAIDKLVQELGDCLGRWDCRADVQKQQNSLHGHRHRLRPMLSLYLTTLFPAKWTRARLDWFHVTLCKACRSL